MSEHIPTGEATEVNDIAAVSIAAKTGKKVKPVVEPAPMDDAKHIPLASISFGPNTRESSGLDAASIKELAESIKERGVMQPITVRRVLTGFEVVAGTRRMMAAGRAGLTTIPAIVIDADEMESLVLNIIENVQRENLNLRETAGAVRQMLSVFGKPAEVARKLGKSKAWVSKHMAITSPSFSQDVKALMDEGSCNDVDLLNTLNQVAKHADGGAVLPRLLKDVAEGRAGRTKVREALESLKTIQDEGDEGGKDGEGEESGGDDEGPATITFNLARDLTRQFESLGGVAWLRRHLRKLAKAGE